MAGDEKPKGGMDLPVRAMRKAFSEAVERAGRHDLPDRLRQSRELVAGIGRESAASTIQPGERPIRFVGTEAGSSELLDTIRPDGREDESSAGPGVPVPVEPYSGHAQARVWDWLKVRLR